MRTYQAYHVRKPRDNAFRKRAVACLAVIAVVVGMYAWLRPAQDTRFSGQLAGSSLFVNPDSNAAQQAEAWQKGKPQAAEAMRELAALPAAKWLTSTDSVDADAESYLQAAAGKQQVAVLVAYNIPYRDCGMYSAGGANDPQSYREYIDSLARIIGDRHVAVIVEPDAVANLAARADGECLDAGQRQSQFQSLNYAITQLAALPAAMVYLDAGHSAWVQDLDRLADVLRQAGVAEADGFSLNVSNFQTTPDSLKYGRQLSKLIDNKHFVVDTSRNGNGPVKKPKNPAFSWCNPPGRALGHYPTTSTGESQVDAYLYIKAPGESDGQDDDPDKCAGGPRAGTWWPEYALGLVQRWPQNLRPNSAD